ncbi:MAG: hypothetical protein MK194_13980, partial [Roseibacillus sp.]|nr:hypothetical protein [Roseibacillus sp.]
RLEERERARLGEPEVLRLVERERARLVEREVLRLVERERARLVAREVLRLVARAQPQTPLGAIQQRLDPVGSSMPGRRGRVYLPRHRGK